MEFFVELRVVASTFRCDMLTSRPTELGCFRLTGIEDAHCRALSAMRIEKATSTDSGRSEELPEEALL